MHFTMTSDGEVFQTTRESEPLTYVQGKDEMLPAIEAALVGLNAGDKKEITLEPTQAFGEVDPAAVQQVPRSGFQDPTTLVVGDEVRGQSEEQEFRAVVTALDEETVTLDLNHPLAGKTLTFDMEIVAVQ
jgi:FKBP-type peptidyl-prolyl cis-trans isomerase SlyD